MCEIHDGIGSNLVTALAVAETQQHPPESVATLKRSLSDLKLTVDSFEPVNALHLLRLIQEAISNVVAHAQAASVTIQCGERMRRERRGIQIEITDDGIGFDDGGKAIKGRGLNSMRSRAASLG